MNSLKKLSIHGLWGEKDLNLTLHKDINFLIGTNGSGKTTVINLIAALTADFPTLDRIPFQKIEIHFSEPDNSAIEVSKKPERKSPYLGITYRHKPKADEAWKEFSLDDMEGQRAFRNWTRHGFGARMPDPIQVLGIDVNLTWLSIHRAAPGTARDDRSFESSVDIKLDQLSNALTRLFSQFKSKGDEQTAHFQKSLFLALLPPPEWQLFNSVKKLDLDKERQALEEIFENFGVRRETYENSV